MAKSAIFLLAAMCCLPQTNEYPPEKENVLLKTQPGKQLFQEDVRCGDYFWKSEKADKTGATVLYYFYGDPSWGKNKLGLYRIAVFHVVVDPEKDPPTAQIIRDQEGKLTEVRVRMTAAQREASKACFP